MESTSATLEIVHPIKAGLFAYHFDFISQVHASLDTDERAQFCSWLNSELDYIASYYSPEELVQPDDIADISLIHAGFEAGLLDWGCELDISHLPNIQLFGESL